MSPRSEGLLMRALVFFLAWLSFACLLGQLYGLWSMRAFGSLILPPAFLALVLIAFRLPRGSRTRAWIVEGALGGIVAAAAYDLYRLPFVLSGIPLFKVFPIFGQLLMGTEEPRWLAHALGWAYHFSNGAALGIMFLALAGEARGKGLFWGAVLWALFVETVLLATPYARFFGLALDGRFIFLTASAHAIFGVALGLWCWSRLGARGLRTA